MPLDARNAKERAPSFGMSMRGKQDYQALTIDSRMFNSFSPLGGIEAKWIIAGVVAAGAVVAVASKDKSTSSSYQQQQQQQAQQQAQQQQQGGGEPCPVTPACP
jgi:transcription initiation factor TFIID subunit TAF12